MSGKVLVIPAAGMGSRLGAARPKLLVPVAGVAMIDRLAALYRPVVDRVVLVVHPSFANEVEGHVRGWRPAPALVTQSSPSGMLDAILLASDAVGARADGDVWITWCDQVAVRPETIRRLAETATAHPDAWLVMPTVRRSEPYIHLQRNDAGRIVRVLHRREGDAMPLEGESDMGLFALSAEAYHDSLPRYAREVEAGRSTGERNFLPFIPWADARGGVVTFPATDDMEAVGVNTPEELALVERYLRDRQGSA